MLKGLFPDLFFCHVVVLLVDEFVLYRVRHDTSFGRPVVVLLPVLLRRFDVYLRYARLVVRFSKPFEVVITDYFVTVYAFFDPMRFPLIAKFVPRPALFIGVV